MLSVVNRLNSKFEFLKLKRHGRVIPTPVFNFSYLFNQPPQAPARFGFIVSTKVDKRATVRNRTKRLIREAVRLYLKESKLEISVRGLMGVFIIRRGALAKSYEEISHWVNQVLPEVFKF